MSITIKLLELESLWNAAVSSLIVAAELEEKKGPAFQDESGIQNSSGLVGEFKGR